MVYIVFGGFLMSLADSVPGVSGGTIAFILGFYDSFITSLTDLVHGKKAAKLQSLKFLLKLGLGWIVGMALAVTLLSGVFTTGIYKVSSLFLGFVLASIPLIMIEQKKIIAYGAKYILFIFIGALIVVLLSAFNFSSAVQNLGFNVFTAFYVYIAGILAISAMVLPGISGSTLLMSFGLYVPVITTLKDILTLNFKNIWILIFFGLGVLTGVVVTLKQIKKLLDYHRSAVIYAILGMMIGSFYAIVMGPTTLKVPQHMMTIKEFDPFLFIIGIAVVFGLSFFKSCVKRQKGKKNASLDTER